MLDKFLKWITDYQSGRGCITAIVIAITWGVNLIQFVLMCFNGEEGVTKLFLFKLLGLVPPFNLLTVWF